MSLEDVKGIVDVHHHGAPSLMPRHGLDTELVAASRTVGVDLLVLKAHEGSTVERAALCGAGAVGGLVLNAAIGGANPVAVEVAGRLGGRVVWLPTVSSATHHAAMTAPELSIIRPIRFPIVPVIEDGRLLSSWFDVLDLVAEYDMVLGSGHVSCRDSLIVFHEARQRGVKRLLVNHPMMPFLGWEDSMATEFQSLGAYLELGIMPDLLLRPSDRPSLWLVNNYPDELLVFGSDLGHAAYPSLVEALPTWLAQLERRIGIDRCSAIMKANGLELIAPTTLRSE